MEHDELIGRKVKIALKDDPSLRHDILYKYIELLDGVRNYGKEDDE
jgi:hypothetical protein